MQNDDNFYLIILTFVVFGVSISGNAYSFTTGEGGGGGGDGSFFFTLFLGFGAVSVPGSLGFLAYM